MDSKLGEDLDCKVRVRRYVLVSQPSRWKQNSERVVVQSPVLSIPKTLLEVPVRRFHGKEQNSVRFIPKQDIEKDTSDIYEKSHVNRAPSEVDAHGVALYDSSSLDKFSYERGHKFWICKEPTTVGDLERVPVVNLSTYQRGEIDIDQVCWYPKIRGPNHEIWTPGGATGQQKLSGSKNWTYRSWVVCQHLDGTRSITKDVEMPTKDVNLPECSLLLSSESHCLFEVMRRCMLEGASSIHRSNFYPSSRLATLGLAPLPTPPSSPDQQILMTQPPTVQLQLQRLTLPKAAPRRPWEGIFELASQTKGQYKKLRSSSIHPQELNSVTAIGRGRTLPDTGDQSCEDDSNDSNSSSERSTRESSPIRNNLQSPQLYSDELKCLDAEGVFVAQLLTEIRRRKEDNSATATNGGFCMSASDPVICNGNMTVAEKWEKWATDNGGSTENRRLAAWCSMKDPHCKYTRMATSMHFHSPPEKCSQTTTTSSNQDTPDHHQLEHQHCISRLGPFPASAGDCLLANSMHTRETHSCCQWSPGDLADIPPNSRQPYDDRKVREAKELHSKLLDRAALCRSNPADAGVRVALLENELTEEALQLRDDEFRGELDLVMFEPREVESNEEAMDELRAWC